MIVRRSNLLLDALQQMQKVSFDPRKRLNVILYIRCIYEFSLNR